MPHFRPNNRLLSSSLGVYHFGIFNHYRMTLLEPFLGKSMFCWPLLLLPLSYALWELNHKKCCLELNLYNLLSKVLTGPVISYCTMWIFPLCAINSKKHPASCHTFSMLEETCFYLTISDKFFQNEWLLDVAPQVQFLEVRNIPFTNSLFLSSNRLRFCINDALEH